jgi:hypothetical protein
MGNISVTLNPTIIFVGVVVSRKVSALVEDFEIPFWLFPYAFLNGPNKLISQDCKA